MIAVEQLFTKPIQEIQREQQNLQKEITTKNKELKDLFSSKYHELLNCADLLNGISDYTKQIITITNKTQQNMMQINESNNNNPKLQQQDHKCKSFTYFMKKVKQSMKNGYCYNSQISLLYAQNKYQLNDSERLYPIILLEQIEQECNLNNVIDTLLIHQNNLSVFFNKLIEYGSLNCNNYKAVIAKIDQIHSFDNYTQLILLKQNYIQLTIEQIYDILINNQIPIFQIDNQLIEKFKQNILSYTKTIEVQILEKLIQNIVQNGTFNHELYQSIQKEQGFIPQELKNKTIIIWKDWFDLSLNNHFQQLFQIIEKEQIKQEKDFLEVYKVYQNKIKEIKDICDLIEKLPHDEIEYKHQQCIQDCQKMVKEYSQILNNIFEQNKDSFLICFYYNVLIYQWNEQLQKYQLDLYCEQNNQWDLKEIDQLLFSIYQLQKQEIKRETISQIIKLMLQKVDIIFSIEYRNLATAIHPEKAQEYYQNLFKTGKFNNKSLKRTQLNLEGIDLSLEQHFHYYTIIQQQKQTTKDQINAWTQKAQEVQQKQQQEPQQQTRFGLNMFWKKQ
ncbi:unnamed protein product [Paramecium pentaurelia]|uniref:Uncharacterized protein n=1 Tax=Paramecium pentaurelia TaxID=43138 RepID=A0A8S1XBM7_9CILI|nr:unnamed protein product [Paramecium pentaurelia]